MKCNQFCMKFIFPSPWSGSLEPITHMSPGTSPNYCTRQHAPRLPMDFQYQIHQVSLATDREFKHHALVMLTSKRPKNCLGDTIASLQRAGLSHWAGPKLLVSDGQQDSLPTDWTHIVYPRREGSSIAFIRALRHALICDPLLEQLTFLEDDIVMCKGTLDYIARIVIPKDIAFVSWFTYNYDYASPPTPRQHPHPAELPGAVLAVRPSRYFILIQAGTFMRATIERLLACPHITETWPKREGHDEMVAWALGDSLYATHFPILVQHTGGLNSAVVFDRGLSEVPPGDPQAEERRSPYFKGIDFDAMTLVSKIGPHIS
jgi:hypothetical protein